MKPAISVQGISKEYVLGGAEIAQQSFREMMVGSLKSPFKKLRRLSGSDAQQERFWALKDVCFDVQPGEIVGVIGRNGAGKSTLLKILSRITTPTRGQITYRGRLASLLEVGTGFHPELTGRENIYLNGAILGMARKEIHQKLDEIVDFAGVEKFLDTPVKRFSSGMYVRLAFAVAAHMNTDILVVDEVLAVGDVEFQKKCIGKIKDVSGGGRTVIFVSHNMGTINSLCDRGILLNEGCIDYEGEIYKVVERYIQGPSQQAKKISSQYFSGPLSRDIRLGELKINGVLIGKPIILNPNDQICIEFSGVSNFNYHNLDLFVIVFKGGVRLITCHDSKPGTTLDKGEFKSRVVIPEKFLRPGDYTIGVGGERSGGFQSFYGGDLGGFTVVEKWSDDYLSRSIGVINPPNRRGTRVQKILDSSTSTT